MDKTELVQELFHALVDAVEAGHVVTQLHVITVRAMGIEPGNSIAIRNFQTAMDRVDNIREQLVGEDTGDNGGD